MKSGVWTAALLGILAAAPALASEEVRSVSSFKAVEFSGFGEVNVAAGKDQSVTLSGDKEVLERITTEVHGDTLEVKLHKKYENRSWLWRFVMPDDDRGVKDLKVRINVPQITSIGVSGAAKLTATNVESDSMNFAVSGAAQITADGHADKLTLSISGAGDANLDGLVVNDAVVSIAGAGQARVNPKENLRANIAGFGKIRYPRDPKVTSSISGAGSVEKD